MKITNLKAGKSYQLNLDTQIEIERTNLFFNEWGEQTAPISLPDTEWNRAILKDLSVASIGKVAADIEATIQDGEYFQSCRQAVLGFKNRDSIYTSFYLNEGSFLSKISRTPLKDIFKDEVIPNISTVDEGIAFCKRLLKSPDPNFAIFPVLVNFEGEVRYINRVESMSANGTPDGDNLTFYNEFSQQEESNGDTIFLQPGYYISPFIKANYLLQRIFQYFGYTLLPNFFSQTHPFDDLVFVNNTIDTLVNGSIRMSDIIPDCFCSTILNVYRKKFCCEFIPDEISHTVSVSLFKNIYAEKAKLDLTSYVASEMELEYSKYKRVTISSKNTLADGDTYNSITEVESKYPLAKINPIDGAYYREGFRVIPHTRVENSHEKVASSTMPYNSGSTLDEYEVECDDMLVSLIPEPNRTNKLNYFREQIYILMIGDGRALNSRVVLSSGDLESGTEESTSRNSEQSPILGYAYFDREYCLGTNTNYSTDGRRLSNYSLLYNGPDGIFEKFYREFDNLLRNSFHKVKLKLLLSSHQKMTISSLNKVTLNGNEYFFDKFKYVLGGDNEPIESTFFTCLLYKPIDMAKKELDRFSYKSEYKWKAIHDRQENVDKSIYDALVYKGDHQFPAFFPPYPTEEEFNCGGRYFIHEYGTYYLHDLGFKIYVKNTVYFVPVKV